MLENTTFDVTLTWACDQDGTTATTTTNEPYAQPMPDGWLAVQGVSDSAGNQIAPSLQLCPGCAAPWKALADQQKQWAAARQAAPASPLELRY